MDRLRSPGAASLRASLAKRWWISQHATWPMSTAMAQAPRPQRDSEQQDTIRCASTPLSGFCCVAEPGRQAELETLLAVSPPVRGKNVGS